MEIPPNINARRWFVLFWLVLISGLAMIVFATSRPFGIYGRGSGINLITVMVATPFALFAPFVYRGLGNGSQGAKVVLIMTALGIAYLGLGYLVG